MAAWGLKNVCELVEASRSEIDRKTEAAEEAKKEMHGYSIRRRWSRTKNEETKMTIATTSEGKLKQISNLKEIQDKGLGWQLVRRNRRTKPEGRHDTDENSLKTVLPL